jgi:hypothetical protein
LNLGGVAFFFAGDGVPHQGTSARVAQIYDQCALGIFSLWHAVTEVLQRGEHRAAGEHSDQPPETTKDISNFLADQCAMEQLEQFMSAQNLGCTPP